MEEHKNKETLEAQITQLETLSSHKPADVSIRNLLADLYFKKGLVEKSATAYREALQLSISKKEFKIAFEIIGKALFGNSFDIIAVKDMLGVLKAPDLKDHVTQLYTLISQHRLTTNKALAYSAIKRMHQLDPDNATLLQLFREMEAPGEAEEAAFSPARALADEAAKTAPQAVEPREPATPQDTEKGLLLKDKFLAIAKEKSSLEAVIVQQHDTIKDLEREKESLSQSLRKLVDEQRKMKEKLLDYDILRNMEISDLKKKIETLITEKKLWASEQEALLQNLDRDQKNISRIDQQKVDALNGEKQRLEELLAVAHDDLRNKESVIEVMRKQLTAYSSGSPQQLHDPFSEAAGVQARLDKTEHDAAAAREEVQQLMKSLEQVTREKELTEETLRQETSSYHREVAALKIDLEELTLAIEQKIRQIDELSSKVNQLNDHLSHRDSELAEKIPNLLAKINQLSLAIDRKMEENSLFAKELSDLNMKIADLHKELIQKDELLIGLSQEYREETTAFLARERAFEEKLASLNAEKAGLAGDLEAARDEAARFRQTSPDTEALNQAQQSLAETEQKASGLAMRLEERERESRALQQEADRLKDELSSQEQTLSSLREALGCKEAELESVILAHKEELSRLEQEHATPQEASSGEDASLSQLRDELERYHALCADLQQQVSRLQEQLEAESSGHRSGIAALKQASEDERLHLQEQIASLSQELTVKDVILQESKEELFREQARAKALSENLASFEAQQAGDLERHNAETDSLRAEIAVIIEKARATETDAASLLARNEELSRLLSALQAETSSQRAAADSLELANAELRETLLAREREIEGLKDSALASQSAPRCTPEDILALKHKAEELARRLGAQEEEAEALRAAADTLGLANAELRETLLAREREIEGLKDSALASKRTAEHPPEDTAGLKQQTESLAVLIEEKEGLLQELRQELERAESLWLLQAREHEQTVSRLEDERDSLKEKISGLTARLADLDEQSSADGSIIAEMQSQLSDAVKNSLILADENKILVAALAERDRLIAEAQTASGSWQAATDQLRDELAAFKASSEKQSRLLDALLAEKSDLTARLSRISSEREQASREHARALQALNDELAATKDRLDRLGEKPAAHETKAVPATEEKGPAFEPAPAPEAEPVSTASVYSGSPVTATIPRKKPRFSAVTGFLFVVFLAVAGYYAYQQWIDTPADAPEQAPVAPAKAVLTYDEIFSRDTRSTSGLDIKMQVTRITRELAAAANAPGDTDKYDFSKYAYFQVAVNSLKDGLERSLVKNPQTRLALRTPQGKISPEGKASPKPPKSFYRRDMPVSVTFIAAFPLEGDGSPKPPFTFVLNAKGNELTLSWDAASSQPVSDKQ